MGDDDARENRPSSKEPGWVTISDALIPLGWPLQVSWGQKVLLKHSALSSHEEWDPNSLRGNQQTIAVPLVLGESFQGVSVS